MNGVGNYRPAHISKISPAGILNFTSPAWRTAQTHSVRTEMSSELNESTWTMRYARFSIKSITLRPCLDLLKWFKRVNEKEISLSFSHLVTCEYKSIQWFTIFHKILKFHNQCRNEICSSGHLWHSKEDKRSGSWKWGPQSP